MRAILLCAVVSLSLFSSTGAASRQRTLWDTVREHHISAGPLDISVSSMVPTRDLAQLISEADIAVAGTIVSAEPMLNAAETGIITVHELRPARVLFRRKDVELPSGQSLLIERLGGTLEMLGIQVTMRDSGAEPIAMNEQVLLFLRHDDVSGRYHIINDPYGTFKFRSGGLATVDERAAQVHHDLEGVDLETLSKRIEAILHKPQD